MNQKIKQHLMDSVRDFRLPRYQEIPGVGLYLDQTVKYICEYLAPLQENAVTGSMVSNYVKKDLVESPAKKRYSREQIAYLIFITLAKNVLSLDNLSMFIRLQKLTYPAQQAYDYFCEEFENILGYVFGLKDTVEDVGSDSTEEKFMLRATIITLAHKLYLDKSFACMASDNM